MQSRFKAWFLAGFEPSRTFNDGGPDYIRVLPRALIVIGALALAKWLLS